MDFRDFIADRGRQDPATVAARAVILKHPNVPSWALDPLRLALLDRGAPAAAIEAVEACWAVFERARAIEDVARATAGGQGVGRRVR